MNLWRHKLQVFFFFTFYGDGVWYKDRAADIVDPWENNDHVTLMARLYRWNWLSVELNTHKTQLRTVMQSKLTHPFHQHFLLLNCICCIRYCWFFYMSVLMLYSKLKLFKSSASVQFERPVCQLESTHVNGYIMLGRNVKCVRLRCGFAV